MLLQPQVLDTRQQKHPCAEVFCHGKLNWFENRALRRVFGSKRDEVTGEWRKLHNEELRDLYSLPSIVRVVKSRRMRWAGHLVHMGEGRGVHRDHWGDPA